MIDSRIPLVGQQIDSFNTVGNGLQMGQAMRQLLAGRQAGIMQQIDDVNAQKEFANNSMFSRELNAQLKATDIATQKRLYDQLKTEAEVGKINSEAYKNNQQGSGYGVDNSQKRLGAINGAITQGAMTGDKTQIMLGLDGLRRTGMISDDDYSNYSSKLSLMTPDDIKQWGQGIALSGAKDPASLFYTSADNRLDNETSNNNNIRTTQASIYNTDKNFELGNAKIGEDGRQFDAKLEFDTQQAEIKNRQAEIKEFGGKAYVVYKDGTYRPALDANGQHISSTKSDTSSKIKLAEIEGANDQVNQTIQMLESAKQLSQQGIYDGAFSGGRADLMGTFGGTEESRRTQQYNNIVMNNALSSLKSIFGGSPTEGEREILLKIQASSNYPAEVREQILNDAITAAKARIASNNKQIGIINGNGSQQQKSVNSAHVQSFFD